MRPLALNLRRTLTAATLALALLTILTAGALAALTTAMHKASDRETAAAENVRLTESMQRNLLLQDRLEDGAAREQIAHALRDRMAELRSRLTLPEARDALAIADRSVATYLATGPATPASERAARHAQAFAAVERVLALELADAQAATARLRRVDDLADAIGIVVALTVISASGLVVWWLNARALRPLFGLAGAMRRFGSGDMEARAIEEGPAELAEMARRFNEMAAAIAQQRGERQALIAGVVHDLRTPLSVLRMSTDAVTTAGQRLSPERLVKVLGTAARQVTRLERMAGDLLDSVTIEAGKVDLRVEQIDARKIATEVVQPYVASSAKHTIDVDLPGHAVPLFCDRMRIEQVLSNLLSNAIKYSPDGGDISLQVKERAGEVAFVVRDTGVGMTEADAAKVFDAFHRSAELRDEVPGSGLGMFIVRRLVEAHGGRIELQTALGRGSTFEVRLPARSGARLDSTAPDDEEPHRVLHVPHEEEARARSPDASTRRGARQERHH